MRWWYLLALQFGMSVSSLREALPASELPYWFALYELDPWGEQRADFRQALTTTAIANCMGGGKTTPVDFMPYIVKQQKEQTEREQEKVLKQFFTAANAAKRNRRRKGK